MKRFDIDEATLARLLAATHAGADPAVLGRARARLAQRPALPPAFAWLGSPAALVGACALFVVAAGLAFLEPASDAGARDTALVSALMGDDGSYGLPTVQATPAGAAAGAGSADTGEVAR